RHVFCHGLIHQPFHVAQQQVVNNRLCVRFVDVIPAIPGIGSAVSSIRFLFSLEGISQTTGQRQQTNEDRLLLHGVHEAVGSQVNGIDLAIDEIVELNLDGTNETLKVRTVAKLGFLRDDLGVDSAERGCTLAAQRSELDIDALLLEFLEASQNQPQDVGVQAAAQAFV